MAEEDDKIKAAADALKELKPQSAMIAVQMAVPGAKVASLKPGPPRLDFPVQDVETLAYGLATIEEAASFFDVSVSTMKRRLSEPAYRSAWTRGRMRMRRALRRIQLKTALAGSEKMMIWMGKQELGQQERPEVQINVHDRSEVSISVDDFERMLDDAESEVLDAEYTELDDGPDLHEHDEGDGEGPGPG